MEIPPRPVALRSNRPSESPSRRSSARDAQAGLWLAREHEAAQVRVPHVLAKTDLRGPPSCKPSSPHSVANVTSWPPWPSCGQRPMRRPRRARSGRFQARRAHLQRSPTHATTCHNSAVRCPPREKHPASVSLKRELSADLCDWCAQLRSQSAAFPQLAKLLCRLSLSVAVPRPPLCRSS